MPVGQWPGRTTVAPNFTSPSHFLWGRREEREQAQISCVKNWLCFFNRAILPLLLNCADEDWPQAIRVSSVSFADNSIQRSFLLLHLETHLLRIAVVRWAFYSAGLACEMFHWEGWPDTLTATNSPKTNSFLYSISPCGVHSRFWSSWRARCKERSRSERVSVWRGGVRSSTARWISWGASSVAVWEQVERGG